MSLNPPADALTGDAVTCLCRDHIRDRVFRACDSTCDATLLPGLETWIRSSLPLHLFDSTSDAAAAAAVASTSSFTALSVDPAAAAASTSSSSRAVADRLTFFLHESVAKARIRRLFDVIVEFPDSKPALEDLRECMEKVRVREGEPTLCVT